MKRLALVVVLVAGSWSSRAWACPDKETSDPYQQRHEEEYRPVRPNVSSPPFAWRARQAWPLAGAAIFSSAGLLGMCVAAAKRRVN